MRYQRHDSPPIGAVTLLLSIYIVYAAVADPWLLVMPVLGALVTATVILTCGRAARRHPALRHPAQRVTTAEVQNAMNSVLTAIKAENRPAHEVQLDASNPTSVIRQRLESGDLYVPLGTCRCAAYPRAHQHAKTPLHSAPAQHHVVRPAVKPCTEGGPCRAADREIIYDGLGNRAASRCSRCEKERYWLPYVTGK